MNISLEGDEASTKTTFGFTAPKKVVHFAFDMGWERALYGSKHDELFKDYTVKIHQLDLDAPVPKFEQDITIFELPTPVQLMGGSKVVGMKELWGYFIARAAAAMSDKGVRTIVVDTMTVARRVRADAHLQEIQSKGGDNANRVQLIQIEYGRPNDDIKTLYTACQSTRKNLVATHHLTDERKDGVASDGKIVQGMLTGNRILEGLGQTYRFVDVAIRMEKTGGAISGKFLKCGYNLALEGTSMENPTWDKLVDQIEMFTGDRLGLEHSVS